MKPLLLLKIFLISSLIGYCQNIDIKWSPEYKTNARVKKIVGVYDGIMYVHAFVVKSNGLKEYESPILQGFSSDGFKPLFEEPIKLPKVEGKKNELIDLIMTANGPVVCSYQHIKSTGEIRISAYKFDRSGIMSTSSIEVLSTHDQVQMKKHDVFIELSKDKTKLLFGYLRFDNDANKYHTDVVVLNASFENISSRKIVTDFAKYRDKNSQYNISSHLANDGSYLTLMEKTIFFSDGYPEYSFVINDISVDGEMTGSKTVNFKEKGLYKPYIFFNEDENTFRVLGMYSEMKEINTELPGYSGMYSATIERGSLEVLDKTITPFPLSLLTKIYGSKKVEKKNAKGKNIYLPVSFQINHTFIDKYNDITVTAELYLETNYNTGQSWNYGNVLVMKINSEGTFSWADVVYKNQMSVRQITAMTKTRSITSYTSRERHDEKIYGIKYENVQTKTVKGSYSRWHYSRFVDPYVNMFWSYIPALGEEHFYVLFNDYVKRPDNIDNNKAYMSPKKCVPFGVVIENESGELTKTPFVIEHVVEDGYLVPSVFYKITDNEYVIWSVKKRGNYIGLLTLE